MTTPATTDEATFEVRRYEPPFCWAPRCVRPARWVLSLIGSGVPSVACCGHHKPWAKGVLVQRDMRDRGLIP